MYVRIKIAKGLELLSLALDITTYASRQDVWLSF